MQTNRISPRPVALYLTVRRCIDSEAQKHIGVFAILLLLLCSVAGSLAVADSDKDAAPFGLKWGMSQADARAMGIDLQQMPQMDFGLSFAATKLLKVISDVRIVILSFGYGDKLWRIATISRDFANDPYGTATMARYKELSKILEQRYGHGIENRHEAPYSQPQFF